MKKNDLTKFIVSTIILVVFSLGIKVEAANQGPYIKDGSFVQITKKNYEIWQNFNWQYKNNTTNVYNKTFEARGRYQHKNGQTYYSLFDSKGKWQGYLNAKATQKTGPQGNYISDGSYVNITTSNYEIWQNFYWKQKNNTNNIYGETFRAKGRYEHFDGNTYYSLYNSKGHWQGYLDAKATQKTKAQGKYIPDGRYVQITKDYELWQHFAWQKKGMGSSHYNKHLQARGKYNHFNGNTYYSLFDDNGTWLGYINANATILYDVELGDYGARPTSDSEVLVGEYYVGNSHYIYYSGMGNSGMTFTNVKDANYWAAENHPSETGGSWATWEVLMKDTKEVRTTVHFN